jgi:hypothetical protein
MTPEGRPPVDRQFANWIEDGPTRAPEGLLAQTLSRTRSTAQRPAWLGTLTSGATIRTRGRGGISTRQGLLFAVLLLAALVTSVVVAGSLLQRDLRLVVVPSSSPDASASTGPLPTSRETFEPASQLLFDLVSRADLGFEVAYIGSAGTAGPWNGFGLSSSEPGTTFGTGGCVDNVCRGYVGLTSSPVSDGVSIRKRDGTTVRLMGPRPEALEAEWAAKVGSTSPAQIALVGGFAASRFEGDGVLAAVMAHGDRMFVLEAWPSPLGGGTADRASFDFFATHFRYLDVPVPMSGTLQTFQLQIAAPVAATSRVTADSTSGFMIAIEETMTSHFVLTTSKWVRVVPAKGLTLEGAKQHAIDTGARAPVWVGAESFGGHRAYTILRPGPDPLVPPAHDPVVILELESGVFVVDAHVDNGDPEALLRSFLASIRTGPKLPTISYSLGDLVFAAPGGWTVSSGVSTMQVKTDQLIDYFGAAETLQIDIVSPGSSLSIRRPTSLDANIAATIRGATLDQLKTSVIKAFDLPDVPATSIGGQRAFSWVVPQTSYVVPLAAIAITEWKGHFYVFVEHVIFDGPTQGEFARMLSAIHFT